jgi:3-methyladenine DNA glycosylase AlkD
VTGAASIARAVEAALRQAGTPERAEGEKRYLKSDLIFFGARLPDIRAEVKAVAKRGDLGRADLVELVTELWGRPVFERRMAAVILLELHVEALRSADLSLVEKLIREAGTWALVDPLAVNVVGALNARLSIKGKLDRWARDPDFWVRRASLLAELKPLKVGVPFGPFAARADAMLDETEFFIRKAIGWVLREVSKKRPDEVYEWVAARTDRASGVTMREAVRYLGEGRAYRLMHAYKEGRPLTR